MNLEITQVLSLFRNLQAEVYEAESHPSQFDDPSFAHYDCSLPCALAQEHISENSTGVSNITNESLNCANELHCQIKEIQQLHAENVQFVKDLKSDLSLIQHIRSLRSGAI